MFPYQTVLDRLVKLSRETLKTQLVGVYLHGSLAMDCFNPQKSDLDLLVVVKSELEDAAKRAFMDGVIDLNESAPEKGLELSLLTQTVCKPFVYPTPYVLHYSNMHKNWYQTSPDDYVQKMKGTDRDLAAHCTIVRAYGRVLWGKAIEEVFGPVPREAYLDSILCDISESEEEFSENPVYFTLNLCRVLGYLKENLILSKKTGGEWGLTHTQNHDFVQRALLNYTQNIPYEAKEGDLALAMALLAEIRRLCA